MERTRRPDGDRPDDDGSAGEGTDGGGPGGDGPDVSVVLPVYNEVTHVEAEVSRIRRALDEAGLSSEIIVVDDGSDDGSGEVLERLEGIRLIRLDVNRGTGTARRIGTRAARAPVVVWTDVDMTYPNETIPDLVAALDGVDQVVGARDREAGRLPWIRRPAKWAIRRLAQYLTRTPIPDLNSGFRAFRRDVAAQFLGQLPAGFSCVTTMTMVFLSHGYTVRYVPIEYRVRSGRSKFHWWSDTRRYLMQIVRMMLSFEPLRVFMPPGVVLLGVAGAKLVFDVVDKDFRIGTNTIVLLLMATQVIVLGLIADLIVRVNRPSDLVPSASVRESS